MTVDGSTKSWRARRADETRVFSPQDERRDVRFLLLVPVYRELDNGNIERFVSQLLPAGASPAEVSVLFIVNNPPPGGAAPEPFAENQRTLAWISAQSSAPARLEVLDLSTAGFEKNMGRIRQAGLEAWASRHSQELAETIVVHLDADVRIPEHFFSRLREAYGRFPEIGAIFFARDYDLRGVPDLALLFTHHRYRLRKALFDFTNRRTGLPDGLATYQLSARFSAHEKAGGFPPLAKDEDSAFTQQLLRATWWVQLNDLEMITEDRTRAEGFNSARRARDLNGLAPKAGFFSWLSSRFGFAQDNELRAIKRGRPAPGKDFFLLYGLFVPLAGLFNEEVRRGALPFASAADALRQRVQNTLGTPVLFGRTALAEKPLAELPAEATVPGTGGSVLPPVAHPLSATLLMPTLKPGSDLYGILAPHFGETERIALADAVASAEADHGFQVKQRLQALRIFLGGAGLAADADPFLTWAARAPNGLKDISKKVKNGRLSIARAEEQLVALFPDWLSTGPSFAREALLVKALNRALGEAYLKGECGPIERTLESLLAP